MQWFSNGVNSLMKRLKADLHLHTKEDPVNGDGDVVESFHFLQ